MRATKLVPSTAVLVAAALAALAGCAAPGDAATPDQLVTEGVMRCQQKHAPLPTLNSAADARNLHEHVLAADYDRIVNSLRSAEGWATVERRARRALEPVEKFCTLELAVRLDPAKARALYATLEQNDDLGWYIVRDQYLKEALAPHLPPPGQPTLTPRKGDEGN
jgi:hypothetical protein